MKNTVMVLAAACCLQMGSGFYIPGQTQVTYKEGELMAPFVNSMTSTDGIIPYSWYDVKVCAPRDTEELAVHENMGMLLRGDKVLPSLYMFKMKQEASCVKVPCKDGENVLTKEDLGKFKDRIEKGYRMNMILDNLPVITTKGMWTVNCRRVRNENRLITDIRGFALGECAERHLNETERTHIFNHLDFTIIYNSKEVKVKGSEEKVMEYFVVGFKVTPKSYTRNCKGEPTTVELEPGQTTKEIEWTYSVSFHEDKSIEWATRWDEYLNSSIADSNPTTHWIRIIQSLVILLCLTCVVGIILTRALRLDLTRYNNRDADEINSMHQEYGWKMVEADVFRNPPHPQFFASLIGTGSQLMGMGMAVTILSTLGFLNPSYRGGFLTVAIFLFVVMAFINGYVTGHMQLMFRARKWKTIILSAFIYPGVVFTVWGISSIFFAQSGSSKAAPLSTVLVLMALWFGVSVPLVLLGAAMAYKQEPISYPRKPSDDLLARQIPPQHFIFTTLPMLLVPGLIPYAAAHFEIALIIRSIWQGQVYYVFGFLTLVILEVIVTIAETVIVYTYYKLVAEDYRWWWPSFLVPSGMGTYFFIYSIIYFNTILSVQSTLGTWIFFAFTFNTALVLVLVSGTIGFFSAFIFVKIIYSSIKAD
eukprot:TRINITY_DN1404_c0_g1_i1.p1 TRINITY_DN1404_c0_g1~~TRINITY_DN1404_c0_g1_i1.p1  ORF type:complete len:646 (+),score=225.15 TRINITY_DN1404_c0_g1_i1:98-2035(+)